MKVFQRALQYNDPKKIYLALLGVYESTEQHQLADELVNKMTKKFKHSCKVLWDFSNAKSYVSWVFRFRYVIFIQVMLVWVLDLVEACTKTLEAKPGSNSVCCKSCFVEPSPT